jgi:O-acetyl-ADP-ribose deacetylase (regulator of RNase III)
MKTFVEVVKGDITKMEVDAIVNAANCSLLGGGGVDGAIHQAAGQQLLQECRQIGGCPTGEARLTNGYLLPAKYVIHTVGPQWFDGLNNESELLAKAYENSLKLAVKKHIKSIAFPAISCGVYRFPVDKAAQIAADVLGKFIKENYTIQNIYFVCYTDEVYKHFYKAMKEYL